MKMMNLKIDFSELARLAYDRDVPLRKLVLDYIDENLMLNPAILYEIEEKLNRRAFRCIKCGYWIHTTELAEDTADTCESCAEVYKNA
jgi:hypothetical protein